MSLVNYISLNSLLGDGQLYLDSCKSALMYYIDLIH